MLVLSIPAVQSSLGKYVTNKLNEDFGTNINIEKIGLQFNGDIELKNIYIEDYKKDTLFNIIELNASIISFRKLYKGKLTFGDVDIEGLTFNLKTYKDEKQTNLDIFVAKFILKKTEKKPTPFLLSSSDVSIVNSKFRLFDENLVTQQILSFNNLNINATDFLILGPEVSTRINTFNFKDSRGIVLKNLKTNFKYTLKDMTFDLLQIETTNSLLKGNLKFEYKPKDLLHFVDKVIVKATFQNSKIDLNEINKFYNEFGKMQNAAFSATVLGTLNNLKVSNLQLKASRETLIDGTFYLKNTFSKEKDSFVMDGSFNRISTSYHDLNALLPYLLGQFLPTSLEIFDKFTLHGVSKVTSKTIIADLEIDTKFGTVNSNLKLNNIDNINRASYKGNIVLDDFNLNELANNLKVGKITANLDINGTGFNADNANTVVKGDIFNIDYNNYTYSKVKISGNVKNKIFDGNLIANDVNLNLNFNGLIDFSDNEKKYDFTANIHHANLNAINFVKNDSISILNGTVKMNINGSNLDDSYGNVTFKNTQYKNENDTYYFTDFTISSRFNEDIRYIEVNSPDIIEGSINGNFIFNDIAKLLENSLGNIYTNYMPYELASEQFINFNFKVYNKIAEVFLS